MAKRHKGKRHKNKGGTGGWFKGTSPRNRNWRRCTHLNYATGKQCHEDVRIKRGERALCHRHKNRHSPLSKTRAIINDYKQNNPEESK